MGDRLIQLGAAVVLAGSIGLAGFMQPKMLAIADRDELRYTDISVDGAPPFVAIGTAIGALRGLIVDYLWIKVTIQKEKGLLYEVMADADLITKLQPRFPDVWAFHGHNMAYNISVMTNTPQERWAWVNAGISLVREKGIRYNPNDLVLCKELAFWFAHKVDGVSDDAHLYYKREFAKEWQFILGAPPYDEEQRIKWIKDIADAPNTLEELYAKVPGEREFVEDLEKRLDKLGPKYRFGVDRRFLMLLGEWGSREVSPYAKALGIRASSDAAAALLEIFSQTFGVEANREKAKALGEFLRKRVLLDYYNMDPQLMYEYTRDTGPLDWRHPSAHALFWARRGAQFGEDRIMDDQMDVFKSINNDRLEIQAMQALARSGLVSYDPFSGDNVTRLNDPRWILVLDKYFEKLYDKHYETRGAGADTFINLHENFMKQAVRELYRLGDAPGAQRILDKLDKLYGSGSFNPNSYYQKPLEDFVQEQLYGEFEMQPEVVRSDVYSALERGFREGLLLENDKLLQDSLKYARDLTRFFRESRYNDFVNKFGEGRMKELLGTLEDSIPAVFAKILLDTSQPMLDRLVIYRKAPEDLRVLVYDRVKPQIEREYAAGRLAQTGMPFAQAFPEPPGLEEFRRLQAEAKKARDAEKEKANISEAERK
ncbi:MAG: hypothetical protein QM516_06385 [Limnohabitans sp.]|jgi:hypothetical protein|nr:hypothetical protein [Limnohabitans sp.]